jgi:pyruvate dehydrogenase E1 component beta subunit
VVIAEEGWPFASVGAGISHEIQRHCFDHLDAPIEQVASLDLPMPYAPNLEALVKPTTAKILEACKRALYI